jgi:hypothetical protein
MLKRLVLKRYGKRGKFPKISICSTSKIKYKGSSHSPENSFIVAHVIENP